MLTSTQFLDQTQNVYICNVKAVTRQLRYLQQKWFVPFSIAIESVKKAQP